MNLTYVKNYLEERRDTISSADVDVLLEEIRTYQGTENTFTDISKIMKVINEYNLTFLSLIQAYEAYPKDDIRKLPARTEKVREIVCTLSALHTYLVLSINMVKDSTYNMKNVRSYMTELSEKKEHYKTEKMTWTTMLRSLTQEMAFTSEMRKMDIEDQLGYLKAKDNK